MTVNGVARTAAGALQGVEDAGVWVFRGVPYAHARGLSGRWRSPQPPEPWTGIRQATSWGPIAPQPPPVPGFSLPRDPTASDEDCLNLNVWTPRLDDGARPVLVWLHGGGFTTGTGASTLFAGHHLAAKGAVVVTVNYRLGGLGLLAHPDLVAEGEIGWGNWSLHDQLAALRWVRQNIAAFGGDPGNVTLVGESAGAMSICGLLSAPEASGLFHRAVLQSGPPATAGPRWATRRAERLAGHAGIPADEVAALRTVSADRLVQATQALAAAAPAVGELPLALLPVVDGGLLDRPPGDTIADGEAAAVPLLVGTTRDECALFMVAEALDDSLGEARVAGRLARLVGPAAWEIVDAYREARAGRGEPVTGYHLWTAVTTDYVFRLPLHALAAAHAKFQPQTYCYIFTWESPFLGGRFGSCHGLEIPFVFGTVRDPDVQTYTGGGEAAERLTEQMQRAWLAFARDGDPSDDGLGEWVPYDTARRPTMVLGPDGEMHDDPYRPERLVWEDTQAAVGVGHHHEWPES
jgi:para-nitrobenzyl esterase